MDVPVTGVPCSGAAANSRRLCRCNLAALEPSEKAALIDLYSSTNGEQWYFNTGWNLPEGDPVRQCTMFA